MDARQEIDCWHAFDGCARFVLLPDGEVLAVCALGRQLLLARAGIAQRDRKLCLRESPMTSTLLETRIGRDRVGVLHRQDERLILAAFRSCVRDGSPAVALMLRLVDGTAKPDFACLAQAFQLTPAEGRVVQKLLEGRSPAGIADGERLSINTVRCHVAHIYNKLCVRNRDEMWVKCAPFMVSCSNIYSSIINVYDERLHVLAYEAINRQVI